MAYIRIPLEVNSSVLSQQVFDYISAQAPNWLPQEGNLDVWIVRAVSSQAAENRNIASDVQDNIFRYFGANLVGVQPIDATPANGTTTWTMVDSLGHTIPAGTLVGVPDQVGNIQSFYVMYDVVVPAGNTATSAGQVVIHAVVPGTSGSALGGAGSQVVLIDVLDYVQSIVLTAPTAGGVDDETDSVYLDRLVRKLQNLSQRPILARDFSSMTLDADVAVYRAVTIDGYNPATSTYNNERMVAVAAVTTLGQPVSAQVKTNIDTYLQANRELNFVVNVIDPTYTTINIVVTVVNTTGYTNAAVDDAITGSIHGFLDPVFWGQDPTLQSGTAGRTWVETPTLYYNDMISAISSTIGVARVNSLTLNGAAANVALTTPAALTQVGTITITHA